MLRKVSSQLGSSTVPFLVGSGTFTWSVPSGAIVQSVVELLLSMGLPSPRVKTMRSGRWLTPPSTVNDAESPVAASTPSEVMTRTRMSGPPRSAGVGTLSED
jgi:hypothetical protein